MRQNPLVLQHLEKFSRNALQEFPELSRTFFYRRNRVYALYRGDKLYYVGLAANLFTRLKHHLCDRHADTWDSFSVYITQNDSHLRELEALVLRISAPRGNRQRGKLKCSANLQKRIKTELKRIHRMKEAVLFGKVVQEKIPSKRFDTIVCPARKEGFEQVFLAQKKWWAVRINPAKIGRIRYLAIYQVAPVSAITHYGRISSIEPYKRSGKYIICLRKKPRRLRVPVVLGVDHNLRPQAPKYTNRRLLRRVRTLDELFS